MRARLLDLGEVSAIRTQSIYHALASGLGAGDAPVVVLSRPASPFLSISSSSGAGSSEHSLEAETGAAAVIRRLLPGEPERVDENHLLLQVVMPSPDAELPAPAQERADRLGKALADACRATAGAGLLCAPDRVGFGRIGSAACFTAGARLGTGSRVGDVPHPGVVAEALLVAAEAFFGLDLVPSLPTRDEMEEVYEWDRRLLADSPASGAGRSTLLSEI